MILLSSIKNIHFIGIGGISMSGLASIMITRGYNITGSDINDSHSIEKLRLAGANITIPHEASSVLNADLVVYTAAIKSDNVEIQKAKALNLPLVERATFLGMIMKDYSYGIAISGCHGKTTTTSMISQIFTATSLDPTILVGGDLDSIGGNVRVGNSKYFITEACEYVESFLHFSPYAAIILNIEEDHLDYFKDLDHIKSAFQKFTALIPMDGYVYINNDDANTVSVAKTAKCNIVTFGIKNESDYQATNITYDINGYPYFDLLINGKPSVNIKLSIPGYHNVQNSLAAIALSHKVGIDINIIAKALNDFKGTHRRFDIVGKKRDVLVIDDYAHHPTEIRAMLHAVSQMPHNKIYCIFQPHTYTRTKSLFNDFCTCFNEADYVIITDIYAAREKDTLEMHANKLVDGIKKSGTVPCTYIKDFSVIVEETLKQVVPGDIVLTVGAGSITILGNMIINGL